MLIPVQRSRVTTWPARADDVELTDSDITSHDGWSLKNSPFPRLSIAGFSVFSSRRIHFGLPSKKNESLAQSFPDASIVFFFFVIFEAFSLFTTVPPSIFATSAYPRVQQRCK